MHDRVNGLSASPSLLRMGNSEKDFALAEHLISLLSTVASPDDEMEYAESLSFFGALMFQPETPLVPVG